MGKTSSAQQPMWPWTTKKVPAATAPSVHSILKAGDNLQFSSSLFAQLSGGMDEPAWRPLFDAFSETTSRKPFSAQLGYSKSFSKSPFGSRHRRKSRKVEAAEGSAEKRTSLPRNRSRSRDHTISFRPLKPFGTVAADAIPADDPSDDSRDVVVLDGQPCVPMTPEELVALSFVLGVPLTIDRSTSNNDKPSLGIKGSGAFGTSLQSASSSSSVLQLRLQHAPAPAIEQPAPGGNYSTLFAKHAACGSLPFASDQRATQALFIDAQALALLKIGHSVIGLLPTPLSARQTVYLARLPAATATVFHSLDAQPSPVPRRLYHHHHHHHHHHRIASVPTSAIPNPNAATLSLPRRSWSIRRTHTDDAAASRRVSWPAFPRRVASASASTSPSTPPCPSPCPLTFPALVATLPFTGGLPPFSSAPLLHAIRFTASAGQALGNLLPLLENLLHKIARHAPGAALGPYLAPHNAAAWLQTAGYVEYVPGVSATGVTTGVGRVSRYVAAVGVLVGLLRGEEEGGESGAGAVAVAVAGSTRRVGMDKEVEEACRVEMERAYWEAVQRGRVGGLEVDMDKGESLGAVLAEILKKPLPFDVQTIATVARLVVAAWTWQVGVVVWDEAERDEVRSWKAAQGVYEVVEFESLPASMVLA